MKYEIFVEGTLRGRVLPNNLKHIILRDLAAAKGKATKLHKQIMQNKDDMAKRYTFIQIIIKENKENERKLIDKISIDLGGNTNAR